jgi:hypothetical protein
MFSLIILCPQLVWILKFATTKLMEKLLNSKFGTQLAKKGLKQLPQVTIKVLMALS